MNNSAKNNIQLLIGAGLVFILVNAAIVMGIRNGQVAPADNSLLWGAFAILNICSLLWAVSLLGLQPMVIAVSYAAGGIMAFHGVRLLPEINVAEVATAGATYSAFGALVAGNATAKVRLAFFTRRQVPFVFIIMALLLLDGLLNSRVSHAGWPVIAHAMVYPFLFCGVIFGLAWMLLIRFRGARRPVETAVEPAEEIPAVSDGVLMDADAGQLMFTVPEHVYTEEFPGRPMTVQDLEPAIEVQPSATALETAAPPRETADKDVYFGNFFPLEIDKSEDLPLKENPDLINVAAMVAESAPDPAIDDGPLQDVAALYEEAPMEIPDPKPRAESGKPNLEKGKKADSDDWLNSHLALLSKLK